MRLLFIDPVCPAPYRYRDLGTSPLGGTEATVLRVAAGLAERGHEICVAQSGRQLAVEDSRGISYVPFAFRGERLPWHRPDAVVCLRAFKIMPWLRRVYPHASLYLWLHCFPGARRKVLGRAAAEHRYTVIAVSRTHAAFIRERCRTDKVVTIYNPLCPHLERYRTERKDRARLIYFSSPHKGLKQVLGTFRAVREALPRLRLAVANPGYIPGLSLAEEPGVEDLGALQHAEVMREVASSFCVFYPQTEFAETFGLVFAEANALGTPVLTHDLGSAREILCSAEEIVDCRDPGRVVERLQRWLAWGPPAVGADPRFALSNVLDRWESVVLPELNSGEFQRAS